MFCKLHTVDTVLQDTTLQSCKNTDLKSDLISWTCKNVKFVYRQKVIQHTYMKNKVYNNKWTVNSYLFGFKWNCSFKEIPPNKLCLYFNYNNYKIYIFPSLSLVCAMARNTTLPISLSSSSTVAELIQNPKVRWLIFVNLANIFSQFTWSYVIGYFLQQCSLGLVVPPNNFSPSL